MAKASVGAGISVEAEAMRQLGRAFRQETDGKQLRKDLTKQINDAVQPGVAAVQGVLRAIPRTSAAAWSHGGKESRQALGGYLASRTRVQVRYAGRSAGVAVRIPQTPQLRGFKMAARRLNRSHWRHPVYGSKTVWVTQISPIPDFFDDTLARDRDKYRDAVVDALGKMARRLMERR